MRAGLWNSFVFRMTLLSSLVFFIIAVSGIGFLSFLAIQTAQDELHDEIGEDLEFATSFFRDEGLEALIFDVLDEDDLIIGREDAYTIFDEGEPVYLFSDPDGSTIAGFPGLYQEQDGLHETELTFDGETIGIKLHRHRLTDDVIMHIARSRSHEYFDIREAFNFRLILLSLSIIPLALITGYFLSRGVYSRIDRFSATLGKIGEHSVAGRLPVSSRQDEFDRLADQVNAMLDRIEILHRNIEAVSVGIAHDLKTPLTRLGNRLQLMQADIEHPSALQMHIEQSNQQVESLLHTFQSVLRLSEIESGERRRAFQKFDLTSLATETLESYEPVFIDGGRRLTHSLVPGLSLHGDPDLINQMLINLLENSIEHGKPGGETWVRLQAHKQGVVLQVGDDGPGIPAEYHDQVFDRFFRGNASRNSPGNGLGLSLVKSICKLHRAEIAILDQTEGAVFDIYFTH